MGKRISYIICVLLAYNLVNRALAQQLSADSLIKIANSIYNSMPDSSMYYCLEAEKAGKKENSEEQIAYSYACEGRYLLLKGELKPALEKLNEAISLFQKNNIVKGMAKAYSLKSILMGRLNNTKEELDFLFKAKELYASIKDTDGIILASVNLSNAYNTSGNYERSLATLNEVVALNAHSGKTDFFIQGNYGAAYILKKDFGKAVIHLQKSVEVARKYKMLDSEISGLTKLGVCYSLLKNNKEALACLNTALELARTNNLMVEEAEALNSIVAVLEENKNFPEAFKALKRYKFLQDTLFNIEKIKSIQEMENKLSISEKEKIIAEQKLILEKENAELATGRLRGFLMAGGIVVLVAALVFLFFHFRRTHNLYTLIKVQKKEVEFQKELLEVKNKEVTDSINYARYIQYGMLPSEKNIKALFPEFFIFYKPKDIVAGDFYWVEKTSDGKSLLAACDCTGHGVPGAMVSIVACNALNRAVKEFKLNDPAQILDKVNVLMQESFSKNDYDIKDGMDGVLCAFNKDLQLEVAAANNPLWIIGPVVSTMGTEQVMELSQITPDKQPVGRHGEEIKPFELKTINLQKGEMLYLFSDGYADQFGGPKGKKFKYKQLEELLLSIASLPMEIQKETLNTRFESWRGNLDQVDDVLIIGVRV